MEVVLGGLISVLATFIFNLFFNKRQENLRWDPEKLNALLSARISSQRAAGNMEAMAVGHIPIQNPGKRPEEINQALDKAWYELEALAVLIPKAEGIIAELQSTLGKRLKVAFEAAALEEGKYEYFKSHGYENELKELHSKLLILCRQNLGIR